MAELKFNDNFITHEQLVSAARVMLPHSDVDFVAWNEHAWNPVHELETRSVFQVPVGGLFIVALDGGERTTLNKMKGIIRNERGTVTDVFYDTIWANCKHDKSHCLHYPLQVAYTGTILWG